MVAIVNVEPNPTVDGQHLYEIRINQKPIARFRHDRQHSLVALFLAAATACQNMPRDDKPEHQCQHVKR